jgi:hypothetical protein
MALVVGLSFVPAVSAEPNGGGAKISAPVDPFLPVDRVATPILPYASQIGEIPAASPSAGPQNPPPIAAGTMTSIAIPSGPPSTTIVPPPAGDEMTPIGPPTVKKSPVASMKPASIVRERPRPTGTSGMKSAKLSPAANQETKPGTTSTVPSRVEPAKPVNFTFPQPPIPLESALRKWFGGRAAGRR